MMPVQAVQCNNGQQPPGSFWEQGCIKGFILDFFLLIEVIQLMTISVLRKLVHPARPYNAYLLCVRHWFRFRGRSHKPDRHQPLILTDTHQILFWECKGFAQKLG